MNLKPNLFREWFEYVKKQFKHQLIWEIVKEKVNGYIIIWKWNRNNVGTIMWPINVFTSVIYRIHEDEKIPILVSAIISITHFTLVVLFEVSIVQIKLTRKRNVIT